MSAHDMPPVPRGGSEPPAPRRRRRVWRVLAWAAAVPLVLVLLLATVVVLALRTEGGTRHVWSLATRLSAGTLSGQFDGGTVAHGLRLRNVVFASGQTRVTVDRAEGSWEASWSPLHLHVAWLRVGKVDVRLGPSKPGGTPAQMPHSLELPLAIDVDALRLEQLSLLEAGPTATPMVFSGLSGGLHTDGASHRVAIDSLVTPWGKLAATGQIGGRAPFPLRLDALLEGRWEKESFTVTANAEGSLQKLGVRAEASGERIRARATGEFTPFGPVPFTQLMVDGERINPRLFSPSAPQASLDVHAELSPVGEAVPPASAKAGASGPAATPASPGLTVAGNITVRNAEAGPLDKERLPVQSVQAHVEVSEHTQVVRNLRVGLVNGGEITGGGSLHEGRGGFDLDVKKLDPAIFAAQLNRAALSGPVVLRLEPGRQSVALNLIGGDLKLFADASLEQDALRLASLRATLGPGTLTAEGTLGLKDKQAFDFKGKLADFDPSRLAKVAAGRINGDFSATGTLAPPLRAAVDFTLRDSVYADLPMTGAGKVQLAGERLLPSEASISMAGNQVDLRGSFGGPGDHLKVVVDAPQLERLKFGVAGRLKLDADVTGNLSRPEIVGEYSAQSLVVGPHKVASASGHAELRGGANGPASATLSAQLSVRDYSGPEAAIHTLDATLAGTQASHTFDAKAAGTAHGRPLQLALSGQGAWQDQSWNGTLRTLDAQGGTRLHLASPVQVLVADQRVRLGATHLQFERATMTVDNLDWDHGRIRSQGTLDGLQVGRVLELVETLTGTAPPVRSDLVIDGRWNFALAETASGFVELKRRSGDVTVNAGRGSTALGLGETALRAEFAGARVTLRGGTQATRIGKVAVDASAGLVSEAGLLTVGPASTLAGKVTADIPRLKTLEGLVGPQYAFEGRLATAIQLGGTVGAPRLTGTIDGDDLAITLYDEGLRLTDGVVRVALEQDVIQLKQVEFRGGDGRISATGDIKLGEANPAITARIVADKLQLFASPQRTLIVSGEAGIANENRQLVIRGKFRVDRALFDLPKAGAPELGDDVVVVRRKDQREIKTAATTSAEDKPASRFSPVIDVTIDLGSDFRFRGAGADLLLAGQLGLKSEPLSPLRATGTVRVVDGTYEAFGRKLAIERGVVNFNGPVDNPNLNIRAMRQNQEVVAGVEVTGTVRLPRVRLVSEPNVPDEDKLSWLMFGYGAESNGTTGQRQTGGSALGGAAIGLIGGRAGKSVVQHFGIDEFSIGPSTAGLNEQQVVSVGKALTDQISVGYEQSLTSAANVVKLTWAFSRRWSIIAKGGSINGLSVLFNRRFSSWGDLFGGSAEARRRRDGNPEAEGEAPASASEVVAEPIKR